MNPRNLFLAVTAVIVLGASYTLKSQGLIDGIKVTLPEPVTVGDVVLDPGQYEIRRASTATDQVLRIFSNDKLKWQTNVLTIPTLGKDTPEETKVILHHIGDKYYFDKIWMEGKDYGYEFVLPDRVRALQKELAVSVPAQYESAKAETAESAAVAPVSTPSDSQPAQVANADQDKPSDDALAAEAKAQHEAAEREERESERLAKAEHERQEQLARDREAALDRDRVAALQPQEQQPVTPNNADARQDRDSSGIQNNAKPDHPQDQLPATASNWFAYVLGGSLLLAMGGFFRKTRTQE